jgi:hypothetical protein
MVDPPHTFILSYSFKKVILRISIPVIVIGMLMSCHGFDFAAKAWRRISQSSRPQFWLIVGGEPPACAGLVRATRVGWFRRPAARFNRHG